MHRCRFRIIVGIILFLLIYVFICSSFTVTVGNESAAVDRVMITWFPESCHSSGMWTDAVRNLSMSSITRVGNKHFVVVLFTYLFN